MDTLCFATFVDILRPCLEGKIGKTKLIERLLQPIIESENIKNEKGEPLILMPEITTKWMTRKRNINSTVQSVLNKQKVVTIINDIFKNDIFDSFDVGKEQDFLDNLHELINQDSTITDTKKSHFTDLTIPVTDRMTSIFIHVLQAENKTEDRGWLTNLYRGSIEDEVKIVLDKLAQDKRSDIKKELKYTPTSFKNKIEEDNHELIDKVEYNVIYYYVIRDYFAELEGVNDSNFDKVAKHIRKQYEGLKKAGLSQDSIHDNMTDMIVKKTSASRATCEKIVAFFIQDCEVYDEITK